MMQDEPTADIPLEPEPNPRIDKDKDDLPTLTGGPPVKVVRYDPRKRRKLTPAAETERLRRELQAHEELMERIDAVHSPFIENLGTTEDLRMALAGCEDERAKSYLLDITNPDLNGKYSLSSLARRNGLTPTKIAAIYRDYKYAEAMMVLANGTPRAAHDTITDASTKKVFCPRCDGLKFILIPDEFRRHYDGESIMDCPNCQGTGLVTEAGDADSRKIIFEAAGITKKEKGPVVTINQGFGIGNVVEELESMGKTGGGMGEGRVYDVEPTREDGEYGDEGDYETEDES